MSAHPPRSGDVPQSAHRIQFLRQRAQSLYSQGQEVAQHNTILRTAFDDLSTALNLLQAIEQEHQRDRETWLNERTRLEAEIQHRHELFEFAPLGYIVTSLDGTIRQANAAALALLCADEKHLIGRSLAFFIPDGQRRAFRQNITALQQQQVLQTLVCTMRTWEETPFDAELVVVVTRSHDGKPQHLRWQIRHSVPCKQASQQADAVV